MMQGRFRRFSFAAVLGAIALLGAASAGSTALAANQTVDISGFAFAPSTVTVTVGATVSWTNDDAQNHTATADDGTFDTGVVSNGTTKTVTFSTVGTFGYHCRIHSSMTATVIVEAAAAPPATDTVVAAIPSADGRPIAVLAVVFVLAAVGLGRRFAARTRAEG